MSQANRYESMKKEFGEQFAVTKENEHWRVRTPYLYPDGDNIDIFCHPSTDSETIVVSDLAETTGWLWSQSLSQRRSPKQEQLIDDTCDTHGVVFQKEMLLAHCQPEDSLAEVVTRVLQAAMRVSDLWFTFRTRAVTSVNDEVADFLEAKELEFHRSKQILGNSGRNWTIDFNIKSDDSDALVYVLSSESRSAARRVTEHVVAAWYDLRNYRETTKENNLISLFDDSADIWSPEDFKLVENLSTVSLWSNPDQFMSILSSQNGYLHT